MRSKELNQIDLPIGITAHQADVPDDLIARQPNLTAAVNLCINASGLDDKAIYMSLKIDPGHWTRIRHGTAHFPLDKINTLQDLCGNEIPLRWQNLNRGYRAVPIEDAKDARIKLLEQQNTDLQKEIDTLIKYGAIKRPTE
jgi:hypothetical protein